VGNALIRPRSDLRTRLGALTFGLGGAALLAVLAWTPMSNNDIWLHLKVGETVLAEGAVPTIERFSFTAAGRPLVPHEWGAAVLFALVHRGFGVNGLILLKGLLAAGAFAAVAAAARGMGARPLVLAPLLAIAMILVAARLLERPHLWSYLLAAVFLFLLDRHRRLGDRAVWLLLPLATAWANLHGGFVLGWLLAGSYLAAEAFAAWRDAGAPWRLRLRGRRLAWIAAALPVACLLNPVGPRLLLFPFHLTSNPLFMASVYEWLPTFHPVFRGSYMFREYLALVSVLALGVVARLRGRARWLCVAGLAVAGAGIAVSPWLLGTGLLLFVGALLLGRGAVPIAPGLAAAAIFALSTRMNRTVTDFALLALPLAAALLDREVRRRARPLDTWWRRVPGVGAAAGGILLAVVGLWIAQHGFWFNPTTRRTSGPGVAGVPVAAVAFMDEERIEGRLFASYNAASYAIYRLHPRVRVFLDSRNEAYPEEIFTEYLRAMEDPAAFGSLLDRYAVEAVLLTLRPSPPLAMTQGIEARSDFALVYFDDRAAVWVRDLPRHADLIARRAYTYLSPLSIGRRRIDASSAPAAVAEAIRALADCRQCLVARSALAEATLMRGELDAARSQFEELAFLSPDLFLARLRLGDILGLRGDVPGAEARYQEALLLSPNDPYIANQLTALRRDGRLATVAVLQPETPTPSPSRGSDGTPLP